MPLLTPIENEDADASLRSLLRRVRQVELHTRRMVNAHAMGAYHSRFKGRGMAFSESRVYVPGDDPRHVDWNVYARTGELHIKQFVEERELTVLLAVDLSGSFSFGSRAHLKRQQAAEAAALMAFSALRNNDKVGLLLFSDRTERLIRPRKGRGHVLRLLREILACQPMGRGTDLPAAVRTITHLSSKRAVVALITDLFDDVNAPTGDAAVALPFGATEEHLGALEKPLKVLARRHDLMLVEVEDPLERQLPNVGLLQVRDAESGQQVLVDTGNARARHLYEASMAQERQILRDRLRRLGVDRVTVGTDEDAPSEMVAFLRRRALH